MKLVLTLIERGVLLLSAVACGTALRNAPTGKPPGSREMVEGGSYTKVNAQQLKQMLDHKDFTLIDVHIPYVGEIPQTDAFIPFNEIEQKTNELPGDKNAMIVLYCSSGHMSAIAAQRLVALGYSNVWNLDGGMSGWASQGYTLLQRK